MRKSKRLILMLLAVVLCMIAVFPTALATGGDYRKDELPAAETAEEQSKTDKTASQEEKKQDAPADKDKEKKTEGIQKSDTSSFDTGPLTPEGNLTLVDDVQQTADKDSTDPENKQFLTVESKNGNVFYLIIDRSGDGENVYFLNLVDEADLMALIDEEETEEEPAVCTCKDRCAVGAIDVSCPVCSVNMSQCIGEEPDLDGDEENDAKNDRRGAGAGALIFLLILGAAGGAVYYFKFRKPKVDTKGPDNLDDYDYGEDETEYETEEEPEQEEEEITEDE